MFVAFVLCSTVWELVKNNVDNYGFIDWKLCVVHQGSAMMSTIQYKCHILLYPMMFHMLHKSGISSFYLSRLVSFNKGWRVSRDSHPLVDIYIYIYMYIYTHFCLALACLSFSYMQWYSYAFGHFHGESFVWCCENPRWYWCVQSVQRNKFVEFPGWGANHWCISDEFSLLDWTIELLQTQCLNGLPGSSCLLSSHSDSYPPYSHRKGNSLVLWINTMKKTQVFLPCSTSCQFGYVGMLNLTSGLTFSVNEAPELRAWKNAPFGRIAWKGPTQPRPKRSSVSW